MLQPLTVPLDALKHPPAGRRRLHRSSVVSGMDFEQSPSALRSWVVVHRGAGLVCFHLDAVFRPATWHARLGAPDSRALSSG